jgi:hypothetical protein
MATASGMGSTLPFMIAQPGSSAAVNSVNRSFRMIFLCIRSG